MKYERHPFNVFPPMTDAEIDELAEDIKANGLTFPILLYQGKILDGWNRYLACQKAGVEPAFVEYTDDAPIKFSLSLNLHRRHLTTSQRGAIAFEIANLGQGARTDLASNEARLSQSEAADRLGVSRSTAQRAAEVFAADPKLHKKVKAGVVSLEKARDIVRSWNAAEPSKNGSGVKPDTGEEKKKVDGMSPKLAKECSDRHKCLERFRHFVRELSKDEHIPQKQIKQFIRTDLNLQSL